jgi:hypothetical protein
LQVKFLSDCEENAMPQTIKTLPWVQGVRWVFVGASSYDRFGIGLEVAHTHV